MKLIQPFLIALQFLTRLPMQLREAPADRDIGRSVLYYPLVGTLMGSLLVAIAVLAATFHFSTIPAAALLLIAWIVASGGLHLDGLADSADAWAGGRGDRERMLAIMKDPYCGPLGVTSLIVVLLVKFSALTVLAANENPWLLVLAPLLGRTALPLLFLTTPYVRPGGIGAAMHAHLPRRLAVLVVVLVVAGIAVIFGGSGVGVGVCACAVALVMFVLLRHLMLGHIGGMTGDTAGALVELVEAAVVMALAMK